MASLPIGLTCCVALSVAFPTQVRGLSQNKDPWEVSHLHGCLPHATVFSGKLYGFFEPASDPRLLAITAIQTKNPRNDHRNCYLSPVLPAYFHLRHHIRFGSLWQSADQRLLYQIGLDYVHLTDILSPGSQERYVTDYLKAKGPFPTPRFGFPLPSLDRRYEKLAFDVGIPYPRPSKAVVGFGVIPIAINRCKSFILPAERKVMESWDSDYVPDEKYDSWKPKPNPQLESVGRLIADLDSKSFQTRAHASAKLEELAWPAVPSLEEAAKVAPTLESRRRAEEVLQKIKTGTIPRLEKEAYNYETIPSLFSDDFYVFIQKDAYYFVTQSGKLYFAPPPAKDKKSRTMKPLWTDAAQPITALIEDADHRNAVWLFTNNTDKSGKGVFFEMKEKLQPQPFDYAKLRPVNIEGRAKMPLELLPLIQPAK